MFILSREMIIFLKYTENNVQFVVTKSLEDVSNVISPHTDLDTESWLM